MNGRVAKDEKGRKRREKSRDILATHPRGLSACQLKKKPPPFWNNESPATHAIYNTYSVPGNKPFRINK